MYKKKKKAKRNDSHSAKRRIVEKQTEVGQALWEKWIAWKKELMLGIK